MADTAASFAACIADEEGVTAIEYGLLAALIAVAVLVGITALGDSMTVMYDKWSSAVVAALGGN